jgi:hypothetical protein
MTRINFIPVRNKHLILLARNPVFKAFAAGKRMAQPQQTNLALDAREAFDSIEHGTGNAYHRDILAGTANVVMVLAEKHCAADDLASAVAAQKALLRADCRLAVGKRWNFDGEGRTAMLRTLDAHEQMLATFGPAELTDALVTVLERRARGQVHRIEKVAA